MASITRKRVAHRNPFYPILAFSTSPGLECYRFFTAPLHVDDSYRQPGKGCYDVSGQIQYQGGHIVLLAFL